METWFTSDGVTVNQDEYAALMPFYAVEIPQGLLMANQPPVPHIATEAVGAVGAMHKFDARETTDDTGNENLSFEWDWGAGFRIGMIDFVDSILEGRQSPLDGMEAREVLKFARAAQMSSREARPVSPDEIR